MPLFLVEKKPVDYRITNVKKVALSSYIAVSLKCVVFSFVAKPKSFTNIYS